MTEMPLGSGDAHPALPAKPTGNDAILWLDDRLWLLDQRLLPGEVQYRSYDTIEAVTQAIRDMVVRGAPAIGITAAYGVALAVGKWAGLQPTNWIGPVEVALEELAEARPTAVNLAWAIRRMRGKFPDFQASPAAAAVAEAQTIHREDIAANRKMGELGAALIDANSTVITHCNAGALATGGIGTALGVVRHAFRDGKISSVFADETRPWLQGARLTAWELAQDGIPVSVLADSAAAYAMGVRGVSWVIVGADRIAANGDVANKIGTYALAVSARHHGVKFMVVAPSSTVDLAVESGSDIPIEVRSPDEVLTAGSTRYAVDGADAWNPVFDVTPAALVDYIVTEQGVIHRPQPGQLAALLKGD